MIIKWLGYFYFRIDTQGKTIAVDPYTFSLTGIRPPRFQADILLLSRPREKQPEKIIGGDPFILDGPGEVERGGIFIEGIASNYNNQENTSLSNTIYLIESEDMVIAHLGYLKRKKLRESVLEKVSRADILLLPVGGDGALNAEEAMFVSNQIEPKIIIPMNYSLPGGKIKLDSLNKFIKIFEKKPQKLPKLNIKKNKLPSETELIILEK